APLLAVSWVAAYLLRFDGLLSPSMGRQMALLLPVILAVKTAAFLATRIALSCHSFISLHDALRLFRASFAATACVAIVDTFIVPGPAIPRGVVLIDGC